MSSLSYISRGAAVQSLPACSGAPQQASGFGLAWQNLNDGFRFLTICLLPDILFHIRFRGKYGPPAGRRLHCLHHVHKPLIEPVRSFVYNKQVDLYPTGKEEPEHVQ